jgi:hypothetical protein
MSRIDEIREHVIAVCERAESYWTGEDTENQQRLRREVAHDLREQIEKVFTTAPTEGGLRCAECGHNNLNRNGTCIAPVVSGDGLHTEICGCKCVFTAPGQDVQKWRVALRMYEKTLKICNTLRDALEDANGLCRSAMAITKRRGKETNWEAFENQLKNSLIRQHEAMTKIVDMPTPAAAAPVDARCCGFCGKSDREVPTLIQAPVGYICNECVKICADIIQRNESSTTTSERAVNAARALEAAGYLDRDHFVKVSSERLGQVAEILQALFPFH